MSRTSSDYCLPLLIAETSVCSMAAVSGFERSFRRAAMSVVAEAEGDAEEPEDAGEFATGAKAVNAAACCPGSGAAVCFRMRFDL